MNITALMNEFYKTSKEKEALLKANLLNNVGLATQIAMRYPSTQDIPTNQASQRTTFNINENGYRYKVKAVATRIDSINKVLAVKVSKKKHTVESFALIRINSNTGKITPMSLNNET